MKDSIEISERIARGRRIREQVGQALSVAAARARSQEQEKVRRGGPQFWEEFKRELVASVKAVSAIHLTGTVKITPSTDSGEIVYIQIVDNGPIPRMTDAELCYGPENLVVRYRPLHGEPVALPLGVALEGWVGPVLDGRDPRTPKDVATTIVKRMAEVLNRAFPGPAA